jgi:hypothetical protein
MPLASEYSVALPVEKVPPMLLGLPPRSNRTRTLRTGWLFGPRTRALISVRLELEPATLTPTTLGLAETVADVTVAVTGGTLAAARTTAVCVSLSPPTVTATGQLPAVADEV